MILEDAVYKFDENGSPLPYYGNTIVSYLNDQRWPVFDEAVRVQEALKKCGFSQKLAFLPPSSFHMTVLTLCREIDRGTPYWPKGMAADETFQGIDRILKERVAAVPLPEGVFVEVEDCEEIRIILKPHDKESADKLRAYRDQVAEVTGIRHSWHDTFRYHLSLDYLLKPLDEEEKRERDAVCARFAGELRRTVKPFLLPKPEFVIFNDMMSSETDLSKRGAAY